LKKVERSDPGLEYVKLLAEHARKNAIATYSEQAIQEFGDQVERSLASSAQEEHRLRGLRAEALFGAVVAGIGAVALIKTEDSGEVYYTGDKVRVPDFRIVTHDGVHLLIEVKSQKATGFPPEPLKLSNNYVEALQRYAALMNCELRFAVFWEQMGQWTLNRPEAFAAGDTGASRWRLSFWRAMATNEMASLGDYTVGTAAPLKFRVLIDPDKSDAIAPGQYGTFKMAIRGVRILSRVHELSGLSAQIGWRLIQYGTWVEAPPEDHYEDGKLLWIDYPYVPRGWDEMPEERSGGLIGALSEMISAAYLSGAEGTIHTNASGEVLEPGYMKGFIPENVGELSPQLPIQRITFSPNFDFDEAADIKLRSTDDGLPG
jgi:hypothetical protein